VMRARPLRDFTKIAIGLSSDMCPPLCYAPLPFDLLPMGAEL